MMTSSEPSFFSFFLCLAVLFLSIPTVLLTGIPCEKKQLAIFQGDKNNIIHSTAEKKTSQEINTQERARKKDRQTEHSDIYIAPYRGETIMIDNRLTHFLHKTNYRRPKLIFKNHWAGLWCDRWWHKVLEREAQNSQWVSSACAHIPVHFSPFRIDWPSYK